MPSAPTVETTIRKLLTESDLSFRDFMRIALYDPDDGYYSRAGSPVGRGADYITAPVLTPVFAFAIARLVRETVSRCEAALCSFVDVGCGDGGLVRAVAAELTGTPVTFVGVDQNLERAAPAEGERVTFVRHLEDLPLRDCGLLFSNELFDAFPFARLVRRGDRLHELCVTSSEGQLDWTERVAPKEYVSYFASREIQLDDGQFADVSLEWGKFYRRIVESLPRGLIVTIDYGYPQQKLFSSRIRRFGTAAAYSGQRVHRDLLASPGRQDLTAHVNFTDLQAAGEEAGAQTLFFDRLARFLLALGITEHELFRPVHEVAIESAEQGLELLEAREEARRLVLPDGIGEEMRVLVQAKGTGLEKKWSFQRKLF
jgi:SAM-dependent MidA family methyltransferase